MTHRASYWKTTALGLLVAAPSLLAAAFILSTGLPQPYMVALLLAAAPPFIFGSAVALGGAICLWRDSREAAGQPDFYAEQANAVPRGRSLARRCIRPFLGGKLRPGDVVQVKSPQEIARTLDAQGFLDGLPFMKEMEAFCGRTFLVHRRLDKINDMRHKTGLRRVRDAVTLTGVRCSGLDHGGCQAECQIIWKDVWLSQLAAAHPVEWADPARPEPSEASRVEAEDSVYICQMTRLWEASEPMSRYDPRQDLRSLLSGNIGPGAFLLAVLTRIFNLAQRFRGGAPYPYMPSAPRPSSTPAANADFRSGMAIVVRRKDEIAATLVNSRNKGLWFDREMIRFCGQPATVRKRVHRIIHEATGKMVQMKTPCVVLENVTATGEFLRFCPQHEYIFWRDAWLKHDDRRSST
jgi:hypothetical protein